MDGEFLEIVMKNSRVMTPRDLAVLECVNSVTKSNIARYNLWNQMLFRERRFKMKDVKRLALFKARGVRFYDDITVDCGEVWCTHVVNESPVIHFSVFHKTLEAIKKTFSGASIELRGVYCIDTLRTYSVGEEVLRTIDNLMLMHNISKVKLFEYPLRDGIDRDSEDDLIYQDDDDRDLSDMGDDDEDIILPCLDTYYLYNYDSDPVVAGPTNQYDINGVGPVVEDPIRVYQWIPGSATSPGDFDPVIAGPLRVFHWPDGVPFRGVTGTVFHSRQRRSSG